ncbi:MAG: hypothetical protein M3N51_03455, partial [Actinomycetota bacterium]|nr:hypothetical protein [Actinomycetota bacterium]
MQFPRALVALLLPIVAVMLAAPARALSEIEAAERLVELRNRRQELQGRVEEGRSRLAQAAEVARSTRRALQGARSRQAHTLEELAGAREDLHQVQQRLEER